MLHSGVGWDPFIDDIFLVARRLANVLSMARLYRDQVTDSMSSMYGKESTSYKRFKQVLSEQYDGLLGYRVMEVLRNHVQHYDLPIDEIAYPGKWQERDGKRLRRCSVQVGLRIESLKENPELTTGNRLVVSEMESTTDCLDVTLLLRQYVAGLSAVHLHVRKVTSEAVSQSKNLLVGVIARAKEDIRHTRGLAAVAESANGNKVETVYVFDEFLHRLEAKRKQNRDLTSLAHWYVSGEVV